MTSTKLLIGQILIVFAIVLVGIWGTTQWAAAALAYQPEHGAPWFIAVGRLIYRPWALFGWWFHYGAYAQRVLDRAGVIAGASGFVGCAAAISGSMWRARQRHNITTYGSARWPMPNIFGRRVCSRRPACFSAGRTRAIFAMTAPSSIPWHAAEQSRQGLDFLGKKLA